MPNIKITVASGFLVHHNPWKSTSLESLLNTHDNNSRELSRAALGLKCSSRFSKTQFTFEFIPSFLYSP